jgi:DNA polymerase I-like protein with 3'-5' exonuclease and polymerase domains
MAVRELFLPRPEMAFVGIDYEQIELRTLAYYLNDAELIRRVEEEDFFAINASRTVLPGMEFFDHAGDVDYFRKGAPGAEWRQTNKNATYAIIYGVGELKLGKMLGWPPDGEYKKSDWVVKKGYKKAGDPRNLKARAFINADQERAARLLPPDA